MRVKTILNKFLILMMLIFINCVFVSCFVKEKSTAIEKAYTDKAIEIDEGTGAEDISDVTKYISKINYKNMNIPTVEEIAKDSSLEEKLWKELVNNTEYKRMPIGYEDDFNLRKFLVVEYIYNMYINGIQGISWEDECKMVIEFLTKRIFEFNGLEK